MMLPYSQGQELLQMLQEPGRQVVVVTQSQLRLRGYVRP